MNELMGDISRKSYIIVSGKGGVGKTTISVALGMKLSESGRKTLVVSIDPAHSLGDVLDMEIGSRMRKIGKNLFCLEFDPFDLFAAEKEVLKRVLSPEAGLQEGLPPISDEMIDFLVDMQLPYEFAEGLGFMKLFYSLVEDRDYDTVIFDTAPTGHTLELLKLPEFLDSFYGKLIKFRLKISKFMSKIRALFGLGRDEKAALALKALEETHKHIKVVREVLTDPSQTEFVVVMIPNEMSILESSRLIDELDIHDIPHTHIIVNLVRMYKGDCEFCTMMSRFHERQLKKIMREFSRYKIWVVPYLSEEIRGVDKLEKIKNVIGKIDIGEALRLVRMETILE